MDHAFKIAGGAKVLANHPISIPFHGAAVLCDRIAVLASDRLVEIGPAIELVRTPRHPETRALVEAAIASSPAI